MTDPWDRWGYHRWNEALLETCLRGEGDDGPVTSIPAAPEVLRRVTGDADADPATLVRALSRSVSQEVREASLGAFYRSDCGDWSPRLTVGVPHFFGLLWLTCGRVRGARGGIDV